MLVSVVPIGNSKGIRIPQSVINALHVTDALEMEVQDNKVILSPVEKKARQHWAEAFSRMHERSEDTLLIDGEFEDSSFDWEW